MHFAESIRRQSSRLAILSLVILALAWCLPPCFRPSGDDDKQAKKCPSGKAWNERRRNANRLNPATSPTVIWRGLAASLQCDGHYQDAIKVLEMVKRQDDPVVLTYLGYSHRKLGDVNLGITLYKQALDVDPENVDTREYLGEGYVSVGQLNLARLELSEIEKRCGTTCQEYRGLHKVLQSSTSIKS